jgi:aminoglycoside phosphotransferase (APT) family kinase protein
MVALCQDESLIGSDFYVMERIEGTILRSRIPAGLGMDAQARRELCESAIDRLVELHRIDPRAAGLGDIGKGPGYVRRQVEGWSERYRAARTWNVPRFERVMRWLQERQPQDVGTCVIHNDYRLDNLVLAPQDPEQRAAPQDPEQRAALQDPEQRAALQDPEQRLAPQNPEQRLAPQDPEQGLSPRDTWRIVGVLDWEMATVGDPLMDLGGALAYWVQADDDRIMRGPLRRQPTDAPGMLTRAQVVERYSEQTGVEVGERWVFYEVFGLFRLASIVQQIYRRYHLRQTRNPAFRHYWLAVRYLDHRCRRIIRHSG